MSGPSSDLRGAGRDRGAAKSAHIVTMMPAAARPGPHAEKAYSLMSNFVEDAINVLPTLLGLGSFVPNRKSF
jgi:hypothetical protein